MNHPHIDPMEAAAGISGVEILKYLPILIKLLETAASGTGTFSTWTPIGKRWITVSDKPPAP